MLRKDGFDVRTGTVRWRLSKRLNAEQRTEAEEQLLQQFEAAFPGKNDPTPEIFFPSGEGANKGTVDVDVSKCKVTVEELLRCANHFKVLGEFLGHHRIIGNDNCRNDVVLRVEGMKSRLKDQFVDEREALLREMLPAGVSLQIKDIWGIWARRPAGGYRFAKRLDVVISLNGGQDAAAATYNWPGWFHWKGGMVTLELEYANRFRYCGWCKADKQSLELRHLRKDCKTAPCNSCDGFGHDLKHCPKRLAARSEDVAGPVAVQLAAMDINGQNGTN